MHRYRTPKALHPTVVLSFSRHFSLRPVVTNRQTDATSDFIYKIWLIMRNVVAGFEDVSVGGAPGRWQESYWRYCVL
jgi:hypothetical protein